MTTKLPISKGSSFRQTKTPRWTGRSGCSWYSLGLDGNNYSNLEFRKVLMEKMNTDIKAHAAYIMEKIKKENLSSHSFYFYILPFNDADGEKLSIMNELLGGGV